MEKFKSGDKVELKEWTLNGFTTGEVLHAGESEGTYVVKMPNGYEAIIHETLLLDEPSDYDFDLKTSGLLQPCTLRKLTEPKCDCGAEKTYGAAVSDSHHSHWCTLLIKRVDK